MSLSAWSYPFYEDKQTDRKMTLRKKISLNPKQQEPEDDLADYKPVQPPPTLLKPEEPKYEDPHEFSEPNTLSEKMSYIIQMLEEQKDDKTGRVTEEVVLYVFLGVFVIFVLDSFVKTGKYSR